MSTSSTPASSPPVCSYCKSDAEVLALTAQFAIVRLCARCFDVAMRQRERRRATSVEPWPGERRRTPSVQGET